MNDTISLTDAAYMRLALDLARRGRGWVDPNPMVGAVVVQGNEIVGEGFHPKVGEAHAEVFALDAAGDRARGGTLYVTLEPCNHHGRTPPCTQRILASGVRKVVAATLDANPLTAGQARAVLESAGLEVVTGVLADQARELNAPFFKYIATRTPFVVCKMAMSLDGKIATRTGKSQWISGPEARQQVQEWRATYGAVMVGAGTVLADDPSLTCRLDGARQPWRVVVDALASTPVDARWIGHDGRALLAVSEDAPAERVASFADRGVTVVQCPVFASGTDTTSGSPQLDLRVLLAELARLEIPSVLLEGGGGLNASALQQGIVDRLRFFVAPLLIGGKAAPTPLEGLGPAQLTDALHAEFLRFERLGDDLLIEARVLG